MVVAGLHSVATASSKSEQKNRGREKPKVFLNTVKKIIRIF
jgi:hypothetical protein